MPLATGSRLGPYEIVSPLGQGGMGEVYKGVDTRLGRHVAIKVVAEALSSDPQYRQRLEREAKTISRLQHPNICTLHDIGSEGATQYLVMEYLEGPTLSDRLRGGPLALAEVLRIGREIAAAVEAAHRSGVVHRDLKPGNVMLGSAGTKVLDFGLARVAEAQSAPSAVSTLPTLTEPITEEGRITGTMPYMAPEQLEGGRPDPRTDIWALGCILYEMATGKRPFQGDSKPALISSIMAREPVPMVELEAGLPPRLAWVVERCLKKDPDERWQSARDLAIELGGVSHETGPVETASRGAGAAALAPAPKAPQGGRRWSQAAAAVGGALLVGGLAVGFYLFRPVSQPPIAVEGTAVAVLPFENLTGNDQLDYIGLGLAAGLTSQLSELPGLNVVGRSHAWTTLERVSGQAALAERLGVNLLIDGDVQTTPTGLRVAVAALDGASARAIWSSHFTGTSEELYELQQAISQELVRVLSVPMSAAERRRLSRGGPSGQAFGFYLQGIERVEDSSNPRHLEFAADLFRQAIRIDGEVAAFHAALSSTISRQRRQGDSVDEDEAERAARRALELDPDLPSGHVALAQALRGRGRYAESIAQLRPVLANHPKPDEAFRELAFSYRVAGDLEASGECLETAVALGPANWFNWNALGVHRTQQGDFEAARTALERAVELAPPTVTWPRLNLGGVRLTTGDLEGAIADFEATGASTTNSDLASNMGTAYYFQGRVDRAEALYRRAVSLAPTDHLLRRNLGDALLTLGRSVEAFGQFARALELVEQDLGDNPRSSVLLRSRAIYAAKLGDCESALEQATAARPLLPRTWQNHLDLAGAFALCGRPADALASVRVCLEAGYPAEGIRQQPELAGLSGDPEFERLLAGDAAGG